ncbi:hypothetical protein ACLESD_45335, partial [Pyxidicoccus sp. 3LFB2]
MGAPRPIPVQGDGAGAFDFTPYFRVLPRPPLLRALLRPRPLVLLRLVARFVADFVALLAR